MDLNTILIILGAIAVVILVVHGIWLNRQNKSKVFDNEDPMKSSADYIEPSTEGSAELETAENERFSQNVKDKEKSVSLSAGNFTNQDQRTNIDEHIDSKEDNTALNTDLSHITISLRDTPTQTDKNINSFNALNDNKSFMVREQTVQTKKKDQPKDIEMPSMPKNSEPDDSMLSQTVEVGMVSDDTEEQKITKEIPESTHHDVDIKVEKDKLSTTNGEADEPLHEDHNESKDADVVDVDAEESKQDASNVIMLYVVAPDNSCFKGSDLHQALDKEGFLFGTQSIFHRHSEFNCHSPVLFSLANLDGPGEFDPEKMENMRTFGVAIFMETPVKYGSARTNLRFMINSAKALARDLNGHLLSDKQEPFTFDVEQEYLSRVF